MAQATTRTDEVALSCRCSLCNYSNTSTPDEDIMYDSLRHDPVSESERRNGPGPYKKPHQVGPYGNGMRDFFSVSACGVLESFPVGCTARFLKVGKYTERVGAGAPVFLVVALEYPVAEECSKGQQED
ncbi:hypothetical protein SADUNF_Sadunf08G0100000 [Salix dunnii]|uniref:Uncharacterized protein n=1 Tax=Salix dunnii TaxID=1413687 RepID=A0A835JXR3_9ROSI|nr:hypothetical protein SADUNF_Sadunf08G0100000 [Salix dunnii]